MFTMKAHGYSKLMRDHREDRNTVADDELLTEEIINSNSASGFGENTEGRGDRFRYLVDGRVPKRVEIKKHRQKKIPEFIT